jgi:hypothetical protein
LHEAFKTLRNSLSDDAFEVSGKVFADKPNEPLLAKGRDKQRRLEREQDVRRAASSCSDS